MNKQTRKNCQNYPGGAACSMISYDYVTDVTINETKYEKRYTKSCAKRRLCQDYCRFLSNSGEKNCQVGMNKLKNK